jgi:Ni,Fe-hydrogenase I cytochrome b subunit
MAEGEKFSLVKFFSSFIQWLPWVKTLRYAIGIILIIGFFFGIYMFFQSKSQRQTIIVKPGGIANISQTQVNKRWLVLFGEPYVFAEGGSQSRTGFGVRAGIRLEW